MFGRLCFGHFVVDDVPKQGLTQLVGIINCKTNKLIKSSFPFILWVVVQK